MPLRAAHSLFGIPDDKVEDAWRAPVPLDEALKADTAPLDEAIEVAANHGRWLVECPDCHNAQLAHRDDHRFLCNNCGNGAIDGLWRPTIWPQGTAQIERELERRPHAHNQNWSPGETVADLKAERLDNAGRA